MRSAIPKVLHALGGRSLMHHAVAAAGGLDPDHLVVVVGHGRDQITDHLAEVAPKARPVVQERQLGTGHAVAVALDELPEVSGTIVVTYADVPLLTTETMHLLLAAHAEQGNAVTLLTAHLADPSGYGRVQREAADTEVVTGIVEQKDASDEQRAIQEINSGIYAFDAATLRDGLARLGTDNAQGELYLTDVIAIAGSNGKRVGALAVLDTWQVEGVNDRVQLASLGRELNTRTLEGLMRAGVTVVDPATTWVDVDVEVEADAVLLPGTMLQGSTRIARDAQVGPHSRLVDTEVGEAAQVTNTTAYGAVIGPLATVGPYAYLRPGTNLGRNGKIGAYVETKNARIGADSKVPHLSYVGDAEIGVGTNIGAATIFVNYDGVEKHRTVVGDHAKVGSDTMLVAPVEVGDGAYTAAGSVITQDVPPGAMAVSRGKQRNVEGWVARRRPGSPAADAAARALDSPEAPKAEDKPRGRHKRKTVQETDEEGSHR